VTSAPQIDGYVVEERIGEGAHATVWAATDERGVAVAIKVLRPGERETTLRRFEREASVLGALDHPNIVQLRASGTTSAGVPFLVMERLAGPTLRERVGSAGPLGEVEAWSVLAEIADAVSAAHADGVLHRDLTGANVIFDAEGRPRLSDFGLAKRDADPAVSRDGASTGTPAYMAPEQWWGANVDERTDVYGLGALLYEALVGVPPWHGEEAATLIHEVATSSPKPASERGVHVRPEVQAFLDRCLAREPAERPPDAAAFSREGATVFGVARGRGEPWFWGGAVLLAALLLGYGGSHQPLDWLYESGMAGFGVLAMFLAGVGIAVRRPGARWLSPLLPLIAGALGFATGMRMVGQHVAGLAPEARFETFHYGVAEASASLFLGAVSSAALAAWVAVREGDGRPRLRAVDGLLAALTLAAGVVALDVGALLTCALAGALILRGARRRPASALAAGAAVLALGAASWVRTVSEASRLFELESLDRGARALEIARLDRVETSVLGATGVAVVAVLALAPWRGARAWPRRRLWLAVTSALLTAGVVLLPWRSMTTGRREQRSALSGQFGIWSELDPPRGEGTAIAHLGLSLQIGRRRVTINGAPVMPTRGLESETGRSVMAQALAARLVLGEAPELVLAADRETPWRTVERALRVAADLGVRDAEVLLQPGARVRTPASAPPEAFVVLPRDLRSLPIELSVTRGQAIEAELSYEAAASSLRPGQVVRLREP